MLVNYSLDSIESENASNSVTLVPRLDYSVNLLRGIIEILQEKRIELKNLNEHLVTDFDENECLKKTAFYQRIFTDNQKQEQLELINKIKNETGNYPSCNSEIEIHT